MLIAVYEQLPRLGSLVFCGYALALIVTRWAGTRVMTTDKRFLLLFLVGEIATVALGAGVKIGHGVPTDISSWATVLLQSFLCAYLHYSIPAAYRRWWLRFSRCR